MNVEILLLLILFLLSLAVLLINFDLGILIMLVLSVLLHKELFSIYKWDVLPIRVFMLAFLSYSILVFFGVSKSLKERLTFLKDPFILLLVATWVVTGISIYFSKNLYSSLSLYGFFTTIVSMALLLYSYLRHDTEKTLKFLNSYVYIVAALCLFCIFQAVYYFMTGNIIGALWNIPGNIPRLGATFWDVNHFGALIASLIAVVVVFFLTTGGKKKLVYLGMLILMTGILFLTNSRTAWILAFVSSLSFISLFLYRRFGKKGLASLFLLVLLLSAGFYAGYSDKSSFFRKEIKDYFHYRIDSFDSHIMLLKGSFQIFEKYPFLGGGYGGFFEHFSQTQVAAEYFGRDPAALNTRVPAHTIWGEALAETGIVGFILLVLFVLLLLIIPLYTALYSENKRSSLFSSAIFSSLLGWFIAGIFYSYKSEFFWLVIVLYFSLSVSLLDKGVSFKDILTKFLGSKLFYYFVLVLASLLIFSGLGKNHLIPWDEAIYAKISKNMVSSGDYLVQYWRTGEPWYEKPPLYMWLSSFCLKVFANEEFAVRFPSAVFGFLSVMLVYIFADKLYGKTAAFFSALSLVTTFHFLYYSRVGMLDVSATFFILLCLYFYHLTLDKQKIRYWILAGISCGLGVMIKGVIGLLPLAFVFGFELLNSVAEKRFRFIPFMKRVLLMVLASMVVFMPWHIFMYLKFGNLFLSNYIGYHVFGRALYGIEDKGRPFLWYLEVMRTSVRIWFVVFIFSFPFMAWIFWKEKSKPHLFWILWVFYTFLFFSLAKSKLVWYIMPIYPVTAIINGYFLARFWHILVSKLRFLANPVFTFLFVFGVFVFALFYLFLYRNLVYVSDLTGSQAELMVLKDAEFDTDTHVYLDRIELPLIYFYLDSPFTVVDYGPLKNVLYISTREQRVIFITKESRYRGFKEIYPDIVLVAERNEWVLAYLPSLDDD